MVRLGGEKNPALFLSLDKGEKTCFPLVPNLNMLFSQWKRKDEEIIRKKLREKSYFSYITEEKSVTKSI